MTSHLPESIEGLPNFCDAEQQIESAVCSSRGKSLFLTQNPIDFGRIRSAFANTLHMHQPLMPAGGSNFTTADIINTRSTSSKTSSELFTNVSQRKPELQRFSCRGASKTGQVL